MYLNSQLQDFFGGRGFIPVTDNNLTIDYVVGDVVVLSVDFINEVFEIKNEIKNDCIHFAAIGLLESHNFTFVE